MRPLNRWDPVLPVTAMQTFTVAQPLATHWRKATCAEVDCPHYLNGWATTVLTGGPDEALIRRAGRKFVLTDADPGFTRFVFEAGQACFKAASHRVPNGRDALHVARSGDWRGCPRSDVRQMRPVDWLDKFRTDLDVVKTRMEQG
jgi:hypothetical protein